MPPLTYVERGLTYTLRILIALIGAAYLAGQPAAWALSLSPVASRDSRANAQPSVSIVVSDPAASEAGPDAASFTVTRSGDTTAPLQVEYILAGTATEGSDYKRLAGSVSIPAGASSTTFTLVPVDDTAVEGAESIIVSLSAGDSYQVMAPSSATAIIADDDSASQVVRFYVDDPDAAETKPNAGRFTIARDGSTAAPLTVYYLVGGTATPGTDYAPLSGSLTIPGGRSSATIDVVPIDDRSVEQIEIVVLSLSPRPGYSVVTPTSATVTIVDDDRSPSPAPSGQRLYLPIMVRGS